MKHWYENGKPNRMNSPACANTHTIEFYTGNWQEALVPQPSINVGDRVRTTEFPDAREWGDFQKALQRDNLIMYYDDTEIDDDTEYSIYVVIKRDDDDETEEWCNIE